MKFSVHAYYIQGSTLPKWKTRLRHGHSHLEFITYGKGMCSSVTPPPIIWQNPHMVIQVPAVSIPPQTAEKNHPVRKPPRCRCSCKVRENDEGLGDKLKVFGSFTELPHCILVSLTLSHNSFSFIQSETNCLCSESLLCLPPWGLIPSIFPLFTPTCIFRAFYWIFLIST